MEHEPFLQHLHKLKVLDSSLDINRKLKLAKLLNQTLVSTIKWIVACTEGQIRAYEWLPEKTGQNVKSVNGRGSTE